MIRNRIDEFEALEQKRIKTLESLVKVKKEIRFIRKTGQRDNWYLIDLQQKQFYLEKELQRLKKQKTYINKQY